MLDTDIVTQQQPDEIRQERGMGSMSGMGDDVPNSGSMDASELVSHLLSNEHIPEKIRKEMWILFSQSIKLSFINADEVRWFMYNWELLRLTVIESVPKSSYNEEMERDLTMLGMEFHANLLRAKGSRLNERELLGASTNATFSERQMGHQAENPGFLDRLAGIFK